MRTLTLSLLGGAAALAISGAALAQGGQDRAQDFTRAAAQERAAHAFDRIDANGDGKLDAADREARQKVRFDRIDANSDGSVSFAEFTAKPTAPDGKRVQRGSSDGHQLGMRGGHRMGFGGRTGGSADGMTKAEFVAAALTRFDAADADRNGTVTAAERKTQRDAAREQWRERRAQRVS